MIVYVFCERGAGETALGKIPLGKECCGNIWKVDCRGGCIKFEKRIGNGFGIEDGERDKSDEDGNVGIWCGNIEWGGTGKFDVVIIERIWCGWGKYVGFCINGWIANGFEFWRFWGTGIGISALKCTFELLQTRRWTDNPVWPDCAATGKV